MGADVRPRGVLVAALVAASVAGGSPGVALGRVHSIQEPSPGGCLGTGCTGPAEQAQVVAGGREVVLVGPHQARCVASSARLQIRATLSQPSTGAFGEGIQDVAACPQGTHVPGGPLTVYAAPGAPAFRAGTAQASLVYLSLHRQWAGELTLGAQLPSDNPLAPSFRDRLGSSGSGVSGWVAALIGLGGAALGLLAGLGIRRQKKTPVAGSGA